MRMASLATLQRLFSVLAVALFSAFPSLPAEAQSEVRVEIVERSPVQPGALDKDDQVLLLNELSMTLMELKRPQQAEGTLQASLAIEATPEGYSQLAKVYQDQGRTDLAVEEYKKALNIREDAQDLADLGYCQLALGKRKDAVTSWDRALALEPERLKLWEDAGYAYMALCKNGQAIERFKSAIDNQALYPAQTEDEAKQTRQTVYRLRQEISKLDTSLSVTGYMTYYTSRAGQSDAPGGQGGIYQPSGSGIEAAWTPPVVGMRDDRILQLVGRINWTLNRNSFEFDPDSAQGAVGIRYKPFKSQNISIGAERLIKIGKNAEDNWLLRAMGSWSDGWSISADNLDRTNWNFSYLFVEADRYLDSPSRWLFNAEVRQGWTFKLANNTLLTPHIVANGRIWTPDDNKLSLWEAGVGVSLKYLFNETKYTTPRSYVEFLAQYKAGQLYNRTYNQGVDGVYLTTIVHY